MTSQNQSRLAKLALLAAALAVTLTLATVKTQADTSGAEVQATELSVLDAPAPLVLSYQGRLTDPLSGAAKSDGTYQMAFALYDVESGGSPLWSETKDVLVKGGLFSTRLGDLTALPAIFDGRALWLGIMVGGDPQASPRLPVSFVAYALYANRAGTAGAADLAANANLLGGQPPANYAPASHTHDASAITGGTLAYDRFSAYGDLVNDGKIGAASGMVAAGLHDHGGKDIVDGSLGTVDLADGSVTSAKIADLSVANADLAANSVDSAKIIDGGVATADLANSSVTSAKIADGSVGSTDLASSSVTSDKIADGGVATADVADGSVTSAKIVDGGVATADLANSSVTAAKISNSGASTNHVLYYNGASVTWGYAPGSEIRYTVLNANCASVASFTTTYVKITNIGSVSKLDASSRLEITFNGRIYAGSVTSSGAIFELRVDDTATTNGRARASLKAAEAGGDGVPVSITGIFTGYGAGTHTVSMWVQASYGSGTNAMVDMGCWSSDHVIVREIK